MRSYIAIICFVCMLLINCNSWAEPDFSNASQWTSFFETDKTATLPPGIPMDKGYVTRWLDKEIYRSSDYVHIYSPVDMSGAGEITLSNYAKDYRMIYTGNTVKSFLEATAEQMRSLTHDSHIKLPVFSLMADLPMPIETGDKNTLGAVMGIYIVQNGKSVDYPNVQITNDGVLDSDDPKTKMRRYNEDGFKYYQFIEYYTGRLLMPPTNRREQPKPLPVKEMTPDLIRNRVQNVMQADWHNFMSDADDHQIINVRLPNQIKAKQNAIDNTAALNELENNIERRRTISRPNYVHRSSYDEITQSYLTVDTKNTWYLIEAMLTQTKATVVEIHMPILFKEKIIHQAKSMKRSAKIIQKFENVYYDDQYTSGIRVLLACSVRDRFLGCPLGGVKSIEEEVLNQCDKLVRAIRNAQNTEDKVRALNIILNANPIYLRETLNVNELKSEIEKNLSDKAQTNALSTLSQFDNIPIKKGNSLYIHNIKVPKDLQEDLESDRTEIHHETAPKRRNRPESRPRDTEFEIPF